MLELSDRQVSIHECRFEGYFQNVQVDLKFPCNFFIQWNSINGKHSAQTSSKPKHKHHLIVFQQKLIFTAQLIYDKRKKHYFKKQSIINLNLTSKHRPDQVKLVGRVTVDLSQVINSACFKQVSAHKLSYCSVESQMMFSIKLIRSEWLNKSISDLDKSSFHDFYSFKIPIGSSKQLNSTKETKEQTSENIRVHEVVEVVKDDKVVLDLVVHQERLSSKEKKDYKKNENIIIINQRNLFKPKANQNEVLSKKLNEGSRETTTREKLQKLNQCKQITTKQIPSKLSSVFNLPINKKAQGFSSGHQNNLMNNLAHKQSRLRSRDEKDSSQNNKGINQQKEGVNLLREKLASQQKELNQKSSTINEFQEKLRYLERILRDTKAQQDDLENAKLNLQQYQQNNSRLTSVEISLRKSIQDKESQLKALSSTNSQLQKRVKEVTFSLNHQIVEHKQKIQSLELSVKEKLMQVDFANKKASLIEQSLNHLRLLQTFSNPTVQTPPLYLSNAAVHSEEEGKKRVRSLESRVDSLLELNQRQAGELEDKRRLLEEASSKLSFKIIQLEEKDQVVRELQKHSKEPIQSKNQQYPQKLIQTNPQLKTITQQLHSSKCAISNHEKSQTTLTQQVASLQQRIKQLQAQILRCRDPSCKVPSEASRLSPNGDNLQGLKSEMNAGPEKDMLKAQETISYLAKEKQILLVENNSLLHANQLLELKLSESYNENLIFKEQLKKANIKAISTSKNPISNAFLNQSVTNLNHQMHQKSVNDKSSPNLKSSQEGQGLSQTMSKLEQIQKSMHELNIIDPETVLADPIKAILLAQHQMLKSQNKRISDELSRLKISIKEPIEHEEQQDQTIVMIENPLITKFSQQLKKCSLKQISPQINQLQQGLLHQQTSSNPLHEVTFNPYPSLKTEQQIISSINDIDSSKKFKLLIETKKHHPTPTQKQQTYLQNNSGPQQAAGSLTLMENIRFSQTGKLPKGPSMPILKKNTDSVWDMESNFSGRYNHPIVNASLPKGSRKHSVTNSMMSKHTEFMDDNQLRIMSIDDHAEVEQLRMIVREQQVKLKGLAQNNGLLESRLNQMQRQRLRVEKQYNSLAKQHEQSSSELQKVWKQKEDLIYELMFGKQSSIAEPNEQFGKEQFISISVKQSKKPFPSDQPSSMAVTHNSPSSISKARSDFSNRARIFLDTGALTQINQEASFLEDTMLRLSNLEQTYRNSEHTTNNVGEAISTNKQLEGFRNDIASLKDTFKAIEEENIKLNKQLDHLKQQLSIKQAHCNSNVITEQKLAQNNALNQIRETLNQIREQDNKLNKQKSKIDSLPKQKAQIQAIISYLSNELSSKTSLIQQQKYQIQQQNSQISTLDAKVFSLNQQLVLLHEKIQQQEQKIHEKNDQIQQLQMGAQISKIHQKQPLSVDHIHLDDSQQNHEHFNHMLQTKKLYLNHHYCVFDLKIYPTSPLTHKRAYSKLSISSILKEFIPPIKVQSTSEKQRVVQHGNECSVKNTKVVDLSQKAIDVQKTKEQVSESICQIKVASQLPGKKQQNVQNPLVVQVKVNAVQTPRRQSQQHQSTVYYSIDDEQSPKKDNKPYESPQANRQPNQRHFQKCKQPLQSSQPIRPSSYQPQSPHLPQSTQPFSLSQQHIQDLQKKLQQLLTQINQKQEYIIALEQELKSNMNLKNQVEELKELHLEADRRNQEKDLLVEELEDNIHELIKELEHSQRANHQQYEHANNQHQLNFTQQQKRNNHTLNTPSQLPPSQCSQCSAKLLQLQSMRKQLASVNLQLNSNRSQNILLFQQLTILKSQNNGLKHSYSRLNQQYTVVQTKLQQANNQIDRVRSQLAIRTINNSRENADKDNRENGDKDNRENGDKVHSKDGKEHPRQSGYSHQLLIVSKGVQDKDQPNDDSEKCIKEHSCKFSPKANDFLHNLKVHKNQINRRHSQRPQHSEQQLSGQNSPKMTKKISQVNIRCTQPQPQSTSSKPQPHQPSHLHTLKDWNSHQQPLLRINSSRQRNQPIPQHQQTSISTFHKAKNTYQHKIKQTLHDNQSLRDQLVQMNRQFTKLKKEHSKLLMDYQKIFEGNSHMQEEINSLTKIKLVLQAQIINLTTNHLNTENNSIRIHHIDNLLQHHPDQHLHPQSSQGGQIRQTAKFHPFDDLSPFQRQSLEHDLETNSYKTELKVEWGFGLAQKIRKTDRSDRSKTSDFKEIISLGGDNAIQPINFTPQNNQIAANNPNQMSVSANDINQSRAELYQDLFFKDQQIEQLKIVLQDEKVKFEKLEELCYELRIENQRMLHEKDVEIEVLMNKVKQMLQEIEQLRKQNNQLKEAIRIDEVLKNRENEIEAYKRKIQQLQGKLKQWQGLVKSKESEISKLNEIIKLNEISKLSKKLEQKQSVSKQAIVPKVSDEDLRKKEEQLAAKSAKAERYQELNSTLTNQLHLKITTLTRQEKQLTELKNKLSSIQQAEQKCDRLRELNDQLTSQIAQIRQVNQKAIQKMAMLQNFYKQNYAEFTKIQDEYKLLLSEYQTVQNDNQNLKIQINHIKNSQPNHNHSPQLAQVQLLKREIQKLKKNEQEYLQQIHLIKQQTKQLKRQLPEEFSSMASSILTEPHHDLIEKERKQLLQNISKTFHLLNNTHKTQNNLPKTKTPTQSNPKTPETTNLATSKQEELFKMISSLALRNEVLENELFQLRVSTSNLMKGQDSSSKVKQKVTSGSNSQVITNRIKYQKPGPNKASSKSPCHSDKKLTPSQLGKQITKKAAQVKLGIIKQLSGCSQQARQQLIKQLNQITELVQSMVSMLF